MNLLILSNLVPLYFIRTWNQGIFFLLPQMGMLDHASIDR